MPVIDRTALKGDFASPSSGLPNPARLFALRELHRPPERHQICLELRAGSRSASNSG
jgi:hypothetical protein